MADQPDTELDEVLAELRRLDADGTRIGSVLRSTFDQLYDGRRTGRYRWDQLFRAEKRGIDAYLAINVSRAFQFPDGNQLAHLIAGHDVALHYDQHPREWRVPTKAVGKLCLLITADDEQAQFSVGLARTRNGLRNHGAAPGASTTSAGAAGEPVKWLHRHAPFPPNVLRQLTGSDVGAVFAEQSGQRRVNELFRRAVGRRVSRAVVETVAQQHDALKLVKANGGARQHLAPEGIAIFCGDSPRERAAAHELGLPMPMPGEFVSTYIAVSGSSSARRGLLVDGSHWRRAPGPDHATPLSSSFYLVPAG